MDAIDFLKEKSRMTINCNVGCEDCPLGRCNNGYNKIWEE